MRLVSFGHPGEERLGALVDKGQSVIDLNAADGSIPPSMKQFLRGNFWERAKRILADTSSIAGKAIFKIDGVRLGAPVPRPGQIICVGLNYKDHADEQGTPYPKAPLLFAKSPVSAVGPADNVIYPEVVEQLDYEVELGVIIGRVAKNVSAASAKDYIAGYSVFNDVSARCCQFGDKQWFRGKSFDTFAPFGPALVTPDEVGDPQNLALSCKVNGEVRQNSNTSKMIFSVAEIIAYITRGITLQPGDVLATGTPSGVGVFFKPPKLLKRGDVVELEVEKLGKVVNKIV
jgi:2-keto-4-pentenoate hydratase/2-oxohepta-3-ene-1,7-dioic acid hydratase in catechol pathway